MKSRSGSDRTTSIMTGEGIIDAQAPFDKGALTAPMSLLERLVWVKYQEVWWPALLYHSYSELQDELYKNMDMILKAQFAMAILNNNKERRKVKIARLLGRPDLEVVEVSAGGYSDFYWKLPDVLSDACKVSNYRHNIELYFDFHRALDQVEELIEEVSQENFALLPGSNSYTWLQRANIALSGNGDSSSVGGIRMDDKSSRLQYSSKQHGDIRDGYHSAKQPRRRRNEPYSTFIASIASSVSNDSCASTMQSTSNAYRSGGHRMSGSMTPHSGTTTVSQAVTEIADNRDATPARSYSNDDYFSAKREQSFEMGVPHYQHHYLHPHHLDQGSYQGDCLGGDDEAPSFGTNDIRHEPFHHHEEMTPFTEYSMSHLYHEVDGSVSSVGSMNRTIDHGLQAASITSSVKSRRWSPFHRNTAPKQVGSYRGLNDSMTSSTIYGENPRRHDASPSSREWPDGRDTVHGRVGVIKKETTTSAIGIGDRRRSPESPAHSHLHKAKTTLKTHPPGWFHQHQEDKGPGQYIPSRNRTMPLQHSNLPHNESMTYTTVHGGQPMPTRWSGDLVSRPTTSGGEDRSSAASFLTSNKLMGDQSLMDATGSSREDPNAAGNTEASSCWPRYLCFSSN